MYRTMIAAFTMLLLTSASFAQPSTLFGNEDIDVGGFGGLGTHYTTFKGDPGFMVGGFGAFHINSKVYLGGGGYGLTTQHNAPDFPNGEKARWAMGYGGGLIGVMINSDNLVHLAGDVMIGGGGLSRERRHYDYDDDYYDDDEHHDVDSFFLVQPMLHAEMNVTTWMRVTAGAGYRFVSGVSTEGLDNEDLSGPVAGLTFRWGSW